MEYNIPFVYFAVGFVAGVLCLLAVLLIPKKKKVTTAARSWSEVKNIRFDFDVDHNFTKELTGQDMLYVLNLVMKNKIETQPGEFKNVTISPGNYTVNFTTNARFVKRD